MRVNADLTKVLSKEHEEKWVALSRDQRRVVDSGVSLPKLRERLGEKKNDYVYMKILRSDIEYSFVYAWRKD